MHKSPVNRKDTKDAVDDKQLIALHVPQVATPLDAYLFSAEGDHADTFFWRAQVQWETHEIVLKPVPNGTLRGTFTITVGGKVSRPISVTASPLAVAAALRELFSNCQGETADRCPRLNTSSRQADAPDFVSFAVVSSDTMPQHCCIAGNLGHEQDDAGNTFDCFSGLGLQYQG